MLTRARLEHFYRELEEPLYNFALRWLWDQACAEEVVHEAFVRVWQRRDEVLEETLKPFIYKIARNLCANELRKRKWKETFSALWNDGAPATPQDEFVRNHNLKQLREALESLPADLREVLVLLDYSDLNYAEAAAVLNIPAGTVASRRNRAIALMKEKMQGDEYGNRIAKLEV